MRSCHSEGAHSRYKDCCARVRLLITDKQLPVLIRAENRKSKKTAVVETGNISSVPSVVLKKHRWILTGENA